MVDRRQLPAGQQGSSPPARHRTSSGAKWLSTSAFRLGQALARLLEDVLRQLLNGGSGLHRRGGHELDAVPSADFRNLRPIFWEAPNLSTELVEKF